MRTGPELVLKISDLAHAYSEQPILKNLNFEIHSGEFCIIIGESGCGKSTLLRLIVGEERPSSGTIKLGSKIVEKPTLDCGIVFQKYSLFPHLTVRQNLLLSMSFQPGNSIPQDDKEARIRFMLEEIKLPKAAEKYPYELSGGMQQRVAVGQALLAKPRLLLMDEPFGALDATNREICQELLLKIGREEKMTVVLVTHDLAEAAFVGSRLIVMRNMEKHREAESSIVHDYRFPITEPFRKEDKSSKRFEEILFQVVNRASFDKISQRQGDIDIVSRL